MVDFVPPPPNFISQVAPIQVDVPSTLSLLSCDEFKTRAEGFMVQYVSTRRKGN